MIARRKTVLLLLLVIIIVMFVGAFWSFLTKKQAPTEEETNERPDLEQAIVSPPDESVISPSQSDSATTTSGFNLYRNEEWGFEFEYPEDWKIMENPYGSPFSRFNLIVVPTEGKYLPDPVLVNIVTPDFADRAAVSRKNLGAIESYVIIGSTGGIKYQYTEQLPTISIDIPFGEYRIILGAKKQYEDVFNQILSSFKFIENE